MSGRGDYAAPGLPPGAAIGQTAGMNGVLYPVAASAQQALSAPLGRAARQADAQRLAAGEVAFVSEPVGPAFATRDAALDAFPGRVDDERPGHSSTVSPEDRFLGLREVIAGPAPRRRSAPIKPSYQDGRRWPLPAPPPPTVWRLSVSYWRVRQAGEAVLEPPPIDQQPRRRAGSPADPRELRRRLDEPLQAIKPQQALDIGLFEFRLPDAPHIVMPDE